MALQSRVLLFGDQTVDVYPDIKYLTRQSKHSLTLRTFLQNASDVLQSEIVKLHRWERERFRAFDSILNLAEVHVDGGLDVVISTVLLCVTQLGSLILLVLPSQEFLRRQRTYLTTNSHSENDPSILEANPSSEIHIIGLCTGLLPAAAAATARSTGELLRLAPSIICIALRLALEADLRSSQIEETTQSWAAIVPGVPVIEQQSALDEFHRQTELPLHKHAYISAEAESSTTLSGPPSTLSLLFSSSPAFSKVSRVKLPIPAAFHARHLRKPDTDQIIAPSSLHGEGLKPNAHVRSTSSGSPSAADSLISLLREAVDNIFQNRLYWNKVLHGVVTDLGNTTEITVIGLGPTNVLKSLRRAFDTAGIRVLDHDPALLPPNQNLRSGSDDVAIVGMSCRTPGAETLEEFWNVLERGQDMCTKVPKSRFDVDTHCDPSGTIRNTTLTPYGCFLDRPGFFDARLFNMSPREAAQTDPTHRLLLLSAYEALEMAGYSQEAALPNGRIGTFFGQTTDDWREHNISQNIDLYYVSGGLRPFGPGRLNYYFKWEGPSYSLDAACSSSSVSVEMACNALLTRDCDTALAGGGNIMTGSDMFAGLSRGSFLSSTGSCKTFDDGADGYCRGEGVGIVVLRRLEDAVANNDNILGVIKGVATNHSAHAVSITHPHSGAQQRLYRRVLQEANMDPEEIDYIEMHGTGTTAGDTTEVDSASEVFGRARKKDHPLYIGSVKPNVGHGEAAAGITSLIKTTLMLQKSIIPPHAGIKTRLNPNFPSLTDMNMHIADSPKAFKGRSIGDGKRRILLNNFNATGGNTSMILEDPPQGTIKGEDPRSAHVVVISARSLTSLKLNKQRMVEYLTSRPETKIADISYTTTARRIHHVFRTAYSAQSTMDLTGLLYNDLQGSKEPPRIADKPSVVFTFTGQGSQYPGMGRELFETCATFQQSVLEFDTICVHQGLPSFLHLIIDSGLDYKSVSAVQVQLALASLDLALAILWRSWGMMPNIVIGHSLGEYPALCFAGVLSVMDMLFLVGKRAMLMQKQCTPYTHAMLAIQCPRDILERYLTTDLENCGIACLNGPNATVVSGLTGEIKTLTARLKPEGIKSTLLEVPYAFHSPQIDPILDEFQAAAKTVKFSKPTIPVASTLRGEIVADEGVFSSSYLAHQARHQVNFIGAIEACRSTGIINDRTLFVECGPAPVCLGMVRSTLGISPAMALPSIRSDEASCWKTLSKSVANAFNIGVPITWSDYHKSFENCLSIVDLPKYAFDLKDYWLQYEGTWALTKNEQVAAQPTFSMTCLQRIESETFTKDEASVTFVSDPSEPDLFAAIQGHRVNDVGLCPSSVYADMAFTAASYVYSKMQPFDPVPAMDLSGMEVFHPLVVLPTCNSPSQLIYVTAVRTGGTGSIRVLFSSRDGNETQQHGHCEVNFGNSNEWKDEWSRNAYLVTSRMTGLTNAVNEGSVHRIIRPMIYKLFSTIVVYSEKYHGLQEVYMDSTLNEVVAKVKFQNVAECGKFTYSPYWIDTIAHLAGFVLNGSVSTPEDTVFISHGWRSMRIAAPLSDEKLYRSYVRMQPIGNRGLMCGDVYVLEGNDVVAVCLGLKFQEMKKTLLHSLLKRCYKAPLQNARDEMEFSRAPIQNKASRGVTEVKRAHPPVASEVADSQLSFSKVLDTIAREVNLELGEFADSVSFADLGVDSLLSISIMSSLKQQLGIDLPASVFAMYPSVAKLRDYYREEFGETSAAEQVAAEDVEDDSEDSLDTMNYTSPSNESSGTSYSNDVDVADIFISSVAAETGVDLAEMEPSTRFSDLGVESLMSIAVLSAVKDRTGKILPASFFNDYPTVADIREELRSASQPSALTQPVIAQARKARKLKYTSRSVFIQGRVDSDLIPLFLIADGAGSAASYINLPPFKSKLPVYALESPFLQCPLEYTYSFEEVATLYVGEIQKICSSGPVMLGGWSLGGIHAFEVGRQLIALGREIKALIMIDSPCPKPLPHMPDPTIELMEQTGVFIGIKRAGQAKETPMPLTTKQHLVSCVKALKVYDPIPMLPGQRPEHKFVIWAKDGTFEKMSEEVEAAAKKEVTDEPGAEGAVGLRKDWLTSQRTSFGANGWDRLVGDGVECVAIDGDHFSIMNVPAIKHTGQLMEEALERFMAK
ncbi:hypothetical protein MMC13_008240 [Lambiella insularis]|nr:hypothetical protein [Lambiella insularis]